MGYTYVGKNLTNCEASGVPDRGRRVLMSREPRRILIVEDDLAILYALQTLFGRHGWTVAISRTIAGAFERLDPAPDWIILDLGLADGDGEVVLRRVREEPIATRVAVVSAVLAQDRRA